MRTTSRILGIIGSVLAILFGSAFMLQGLFPAPSFSDGFFFGDDIYKTAWLPGPADSSAFSSNEGATYFSIGVAAVLGGLIGIAGCIIVNRRNKAAGALFIVASVISVGTFYPTVLFIIAAVQALKKLRPVLPMMPLYAAYPPPYGMPCGAYPPPGMYPPPQPPGVYPPPPAPGMNAQPQAPGTNAQPQAPGAYPSPPPQQFGAYPPPPAPGTNAQPQAPGTSPPNTTAWPPYPPAP